MQDRRSKVQIWINHGARPVGDERGASMVEYAWILALIAVALIGALVFFGPAVGAEFSEAATAVATDQAAEEEESDDDDSDDDDDDD